MLSNEVALPLELLRTGTVSLLYVLSILGWGHLLCRGFANATRFPDWVAARIVMGCLALYVAFVLCSIPGLLRPAVVGTVLAFGVVAGVAGGAFTRKSWAHLAEYRLWPRDVRVLCGIVCVLGLLQLASGLTPLIFYDSQVYQLLAPAQFLRAGGLVHIPWNVQTNSPLALQLVLGMSWSPP